MRLPPLIQSLALAIVALAALLASPSSAQGQLLPDDVEVPSYSQHEVLVYPARFPVYLSLEDPVEGELDVRALRSAVLDHLRKQPYFDLTPTPTRVEDMPSRVDLAQRLFDANESLGLGEQYFLSFSLDSAVSELQNAASDFRSGFGELLAPDAYARTYQFLAFSLLERAGESDTAASDKREARDAMMELVRIAPNVVLDEKRQPRSRVALYREARELVLADRLWREPSTEKARAIAREMGVTFVVFPRVVARPDGLFAEIDVFDMRSEEFYRSDTALTGNPDFDADLVDASLSRFTSGATPRPAPPEAKEPGVAGRVFIDTAFTYFLYLDGPTRAPFDNLGASFGVTWMITNNFSLDGRFTLTVSGTDRDRDLQSTFNSLRGLIGVGLSADFDWIRPWLITGIELAKPTNFVVTRDPYCKEPWGPDDPLCGGVTRFDVALLAGLAATAGVDIGVDPIFFRVGGTFAFYVFPFDEGKELNFPFGFDVGVEYRF